MVAWPLWPQFLQRKAEMPLEAVETEEVLLEALLEEPSSLNFNAFPLVVSWGKQELHPLA
jgi:hypothetical protein